MMFNNRRQTKDRTVLQKIKEIVKDSYLYLSEYSLSLFRDTEKVAEIDLDTYDKDENKNEENDCYFIENYSPKEFEENAKRIILFCWNKTYPADSFFDIDLESYDLESEEEFKGYSHEKIMMKIYNRR